MSSYKDSVTPSASASRLIGRVKWFNNKAGYGFITVTDGERSGSDIFVHHSAILVENQQYKYLVQGEYVEFTEVSATSGPHEYQASNVLGVKGGKLMCETRREFKIARTTYKTSKTVEPDQEPEQVRQTEQVRQPRQKRVPREPSTLRDNVEVQGENDKKDWTLVQKGSSKASQDVKPSRKYAPRKTASVTNAESK